MSVQGFEAECKVSVGYCMYRLWISILSLFFLCLSFQVWAEDITAEQTKGLDEQVQDIKQDVIDLTSELNLLEEKLLFPSNTEVALFISLNQGDDFRLDSVQIKLANKIIAYHIYSYRELEAMRKGGVQKIYTGNIKTGEHNLVVSFKGEASAGGEYSRSAQYTLNKKIGPKFVEIKLAGPDVGAADVQFKDW